LEITQTQTTAVNNIRDLKFLSSMQDKNYICLK